MVFYMHVEDHVSALILIQGNGATGEYFCIGGNEEKSNLEVVNKICEVLDIELPREYSYKKLIRFIKDRPGHDLRYSINCKKLETNLKWVKQYDFDKGMEITVKWYLKNIDWCTNLYFSSTILP